MSFLHRLQLDFSAVPELPEVETTLRGITPFLQQQRIESVSVRNGNLRWPVPADLSSILRGHTVLRVWRRGKYLLIDFSHGCLIVHLGMSGSLRVLTAPMTPAAHDHIDLMLASGHILRYTDPRRFGCFLWCDGDPMEMPQLASMGPEPLSEEFDAEYLWRQSRGRKVAAKQWLMNNAVVVGVGNIYANEALFMAGVRPQRPAGKLKRVEVERLVEAVRTVLARAIEMGGTTLRDFVDSEGKPGYFSQELAAYGRGGEPCVRCDATLKELRLGQRSTVYCPGCQV